MKPLNACRVLVTPTSFGTQDKTLKPYLEEKVGEVIYNTTGKKLSPDQLAEVLPGVDGYIAGLDEINASVIATAGDLRVISRYGVGINNVDMDAAREHGIVVTNTPGANAKSVAELAVLMMLSLLRPVAEANRRTKAGEWPRFKGISLEGKTVGLIGFGAIGKETARRLQGFDCRILAFDIIQDEDFAVSNRVEYVSLDALVGQSDIISLHLPSIPETFNLVDAGFLEKMKPGSVLVNTARGELVDEAALAAVLETGHLKGAALDAFKQEPPDADNPLLGMEQVILTPHMGAHSDSATNAMGWMSTLDCLAVLKGEEPKYRVI